MWYNRTQDQFNAKGVSAMAELTLEELQRDFGFTISGTKISGGGRRVSFLQNAGVMYERVVAPMVTSGAWEKARFHKGLVKTVIVERGWIGTARKHVDLFDFSVAKAGTVLNFGSGTPYNIFLPERAIINVLTHGDTSPKYGNPSRSNVDFWPSEILEAACEQYNQTHFLNEHKDLAFLNQEQREGKSAQDVISKG